MTQPTDNQQRVRTQTLNWKELVLKRWKKDWTKPEPGYEFTGRKFDTPTNGGPSRHE